MYSVLYLLCFHDRNAEDQNEAEGHGGSFSRVEYCSQVGTAAEDAPSRVPNRDIRKRGRTPNHRKSMVRLSVTELFMDVPSHMLNDATLHRSLLFSLFLADIPFGSDSGPSTH